jgi:hypothetical protein
MAQDRKKRWNPGRGIRTRESIEISAVPASVTSPKVDSSRVPTAPQSYPDNSAHQSEQYALVEAVETAPRSRIPMLPRSHILSGGRPHARKEGLLRSHTRSATRILPRRGSERRVSRLPPHGPVDCLLASSSLWSRRNCRGCRSGIPGTGLGSRHGLALSRCPATVDPRGKKKVIRTRAAPGCRPWFRTTETKTGVEGRRSPRNLVFRA